MVFFFFFLRLSLFWLIMRSYVLYGSDISLEYVFGMVWFGQGVLGISWVSG